MFRFIYIFLIISCSNIEIIDSEQEVKKNISSKKTQADITTEAPKIENSLQINKFCTKLTERFKKYNWSKPECDKVQWNSVRKSHFGHPIMWTIFENTPIKNTTVLLCGVHPDEITPVKFCFDIINDLRKNPSKYKESRIVIAPIVTVDPFFYKKPTRTNSRKVDVNRNFPTTDWSTKALELWKKRYYKNKRRFPGHKALTEQETIFQVNLIKLYNPNYVISVHAPLQLLDYDGPSLKSKDSSETKKLLKQMSEKAGNYKVANYPFYPGSLGNWAGNERKIPTFTLELPNSDWNKTDRYFKIFSPAVYHVFSIKNK